MLQFYLMPKVESLTKNGTQKSQHGKLQLTLIKNKYEKFSTFFIHGGNYNVYGICINTFNLCIYVYQDQYNSGNTI